MPRRVDPVQGRRQDRHAAAAGGEGRRVRLAIDAHGQPADHCHAGPGQLVGDLLRGRAAVPGRAPRAHYRHRRRHEACWVAGAVQDRWPRIGNAESRWIVGVERRERRLRHRPSRRPPPGAPRRAHPVAGCARTPPAHPAAAVAGRPAAPSPAAHAPRAEPNRSSMPGEADAADSRNQRDRNPVGTVGLSVDRGHVECPPVAERGSGIRGVDSSACRRPCASDPDHAATSGR